jgi:hypothetical protein
MFVSDVSLRTARPAANFFRPWLVISDSILYKKSDWFTCDPLFQCRSEILFCAKPLKIGPQLGWFIRSPFAETSIEAGFPEYAYDYPYNIYLSLCPRFAKSEWSDHQNKNNNNDIPPVVLSWGYVRHLKRRKASNFNIQWSARFVNDEMTPINELKFRVFWESKVDFES